MATTKKEVVANAPSQDAKLTIATNAPAPVPPAQPAKVDEPTSPELERLMTEKADLRKRLRMLGDDATEAQFAEVENLQAKNREAIKAEIANIARTKMEQERKEREEKILAFQRDFEGAIREELGFYFDNVKGKTFTELPADVQARMNELSANTTSKRDALNNALLGGKRVTAPSTNGQASTGERGKVKQHVIDTYNTMRAQGKTDTEIRSHLIKVEGLNDGSVGNYIREYKTENGIA